MKEKKLELLARITRRQQAGTAKVELTIGDTSQKDTVQHNCIVINNACEAILNEVIDYVDDTEGVRKVVRNNGLKIYFI